MKVGMIAPFPPKEGGTANYAKKVYDALNGYLTVNLLQWNMPDGGFWRKLFFPLGYWHKLKQFIDEQDILHVQYHTGDYYPLFLPLLFLLKRKRKVILTLHERDDRFPLIIRIYHHLWYRLADQLMVHNNQHYTSLPKRLRAKAKVVRHGVTDKSALWTPIPGRIVIPGFVQRWKGIDLVIKAVKLLENPALSLVVMGKIGDVVYAKELRKLAKGQKNVQLNFGYLPQKKYDEELAKADICILPYREITSSEAMSDALGMGIPLIVSDIPQFKQNYPHLCFFRTENVEDLVDKIKTFFDPNSGEKERVTLAVQRVREKNSWQRITRKELLPLYIQLL